MYNMYNNNVITNYQKGVVSNEQKIQKNNYKHICYSYISM